MDDLVKRLREGCVTGNYEGLKFIEHSKTDKTMNEAADRIEYLEEVLSVALIYLDDEADVVDGTDGKPVANRAMSMATFIRMGLGNQND